MRLTLDGIAHEFMPIKTFREMHELPSDFAIALFEPKDYSGLGRIDGAGVELNSVRAAVIAALPTRQTPQGWLGLIPELTRVFRERLYAINERVNLRDVEIDFAVAGFSDVCYAVVYTLLRGSAPPFEAIYGAWLDSTARVSQTIHPYRDWQVRIVTHAYGRAGMIVSAGAETFYVQDSALACPAEGFMAALLGEVANRILGTSA